MKALQAKIKGYRFKTLLGLRGKLEMAKRCLQFKSLHDLSGADQPMEEESVSDASSEEEIIVNGDY